MRKSLSNFTSVAKSLLLLMLFWNISTYGHRPGEGEYVQDGMRYIVFQEDENPLWLELMGPIAPPPTAEDINNGDYLLNQTIDIPEELLIPGYVIFEKDALRPAIVEKIGENAFSSRPLAKINLPSSIKRIGKRAFDGTKIKEINFPDNLVIIGQEAFRNTELTRVSLPESVRVIEYGAFSRCFRITDVDLPSTLTTLGGWVFRYSYRIKNIYCRAITPPEAFDTDFGIVYYDRYPDQPELPYGPNIYECVLHVPAESVDLYRNAPGWRWFYNIVPIEETSGEEMLPDEGGAPPHGISYRRGDFESGMSCR